MLITYMFPPIAGAGIQRMLKFIKYLPDHNITPIVFCPKEAIWRAMDHKNLELPYVKKTKTYKCGVERLKRYYHLRYNKGLQNHPYFYLLGLKYICLMDIFSSWYLECRKKALSIAIEEKIDCVLTTSPPHSVHFFGKYIKSRLNIPWIMDLRDSMYNSPNRDFSKKTAWFEAFMEGFYEKQFYREADAIISVSQPILNSICERYSHSGFENKMNLITNGFDDEDFENINNKNLKNDKLTITYTGSFLGKQTPEHFLQALSELCAENKVNSQDILVQFIGHFDEHICSVIRKNSTAFTVKLIEHQPYDIALKYQKNSDLLLLINSMDKAQGGDQVFTGKFFEYLGALKPIFALTPDGPLKETIEKGRFGFIAPPRDIDAIGKQFKLLYDIWKREKNIPFDPDMELRNRFTRKKLTEKLAKLIWNAAENGRI